MIYIIIGFILVWVFFSYLHTNDLALIERLNEDKIDNSTTINKYNVVEKVEVINRRNK